MVQHEEQGMTRMSDPDRQSSLKHNANYSQWNSQPGLASQLFLRMHVSVLNSHSLHSMANSCCGAAVCLRMEGAHSATQNDISCRETGAPRTSCENAMGGRHATDGKDAGG